METPPQIPGLTLRRRLAIGGMGELFLVDRVAADGLRTSAVLKRLLPGADATHAELFAREGDALAQLASPHIVRLLDRGPGWLLFEHLDGVDLATLLAERARRGRPLPLSAAVAVALGVADALIDLHEATDAAGAALGLVHRDVNPTNVMVTRDGALKLIDLGVVRTALTDAATVAGVKGTLAYMAPEQLHGRVAGPAADLYAAGLVAYEALTGVPARPLGAAVGLAELLAARERLPTPPSQLRLRVPAALDAVILHALAPDPEARPPSARAWREALLPLAASDPPDAGRAALAAAVAAVPSAAAETAPTPAPPTRTVVALATAPPVGHAPPSSPAAPAPPAAPGAGPPPRRATRALVVLALVAAFALTALFVLPRDEPPEDPRPPARPLALADVVPEAADTTVSPRPPEPPASDVVVAAPDAAAAAVPDAAAAPDAAAVAAPDAVAAADTAAAPAPADAGAAATDTAQAADTRHAPPDAHRAPRSAPPRAVQVLAGARGPVHVTAGARRGLAPLATGPLADGDRAALTLSGGRTPLRLGAFMVRRSDAFSVTFNAPEGTWYEVKCGGATRLTPTQAWTFGAAGLSCEALARDGDALAFRLAPEPP